MKISLTSRQSSTNGCGIPVLEGRVSADLKVPLAVDSYDG